MAGTDTATVRVKTGGGGAATEGVSGVDGTAMAAARGAMAETEPTGTRTGSVTGVAAVWTPGGVAGVTATDTGGAGAAGAETGGADACTGSLTAVAGAETGRADAGTGGFTAAAGGGGDAGGLTTALEEIGTEAAGTWTGGETGFEGAETDSECVAAGAG